MLYRFKKRSRAYIARYATRNTKFKITNWKPNSCESKAICVNPNTLSDYQVGDYYAEKLRVGGPVWVRNRSLEPAIDSPKEAISTMLLYDLV